jgi:hypothetical protein
MMTINNRKGTFMKINELINELKDLQVEFGIDEVDILIKDTKYKISQVYLEDYSDGIIKIVIEGNNK